MKFGKKFLENLLNGFVEDCGKAVDNLDDLVNKRKDLGEWFEDGIDRRVDRAKNNISNLVDDVNDNLEKIPNRIERAKDKAYSLFKVESDMPLMVGDVIGVNRITYLHFGIYIGDSRVIHYQGDGDIGINNYVVETSMQEFISGQSEYFALDFKHINEEVIDNFGVERFEKIYSSWETVERAKSKLYKGDYHLLFNNCEHFASWCKIGNKEMRQCFSLLHRRYYKY